MVYLEYHVESKQVVKIHDLIPSVPEGYDYAISNAFKVGDEFEQTIWINEVDKNKNVLSYSAIRNNPYAKRLLQENEKLKEEINNLKLVNADLTYQLMLKGVI